MRILKLLSLGLILLSSKMAFGSHAAGGYFEYTCLGNNEYKIDYYFLRDCSGVQAQSSITLFLTNSCANPNCFPVNGIQAPLVSTANVNYGCGDGCNSSGDSPKLQLIKYSTVITLPYACADWKVQVSISQRNIVDYCEYLSTGLYYNYCIINNTGGNCSSSVKIDGAPYAVGCAGEFGSALYEVINTNGNVLIYDFVYPQEGDCQSHWDMNFVGNSNVNKPFPSSTNFDLLNGTFTFSPNNNQGTSYFAVRIREYDINNVLISTTVVDGMIFVSDECTPGNPITFSDWFFDDDNEFHVNATGEFCAELHLTPNGNNENIVDIQIQNLPPYLTPNFEYNNDGTANVVICGEFPSEVLCQELEISFSVKASTDQASCLNYVTGGGYSGYYKIIKERGDYCPENLYFTNRNSVSGNIMPLTARAEDRIWIGDNMPAPYDPTQSGIEGPVEVPNNGHYTAGIEIVLPSCDLGTGCVTLQGNVTIEIAPGSCSVDCYREPLSVNVKEIFKCSQERLDVITTGEGPFTYVLIILGDTITSNIGVFQIHDIISEQDNGQVPYTINVYDAIGDSGTFSGNILGTKRFYEPIIDNKIYINYPPGSVLGDPGYYYSANLGVYSATPAYWTDSINTSPPWYGATHMRLIIWNQWGEEINSIDHDLELQSDGSGGEDWSLNQGEFWWNGKYMNGIWADCYESSNETWNYRLSSRNCFNDENIAFFVNEIDEQSITFIFSCTDDDPWNPVEEKSVSNTGDDNNDYAQSQKIEGASRLPEITISSEADLEIGVIPNPVNDHFFIVSHFDELNNINLSDQYGNIVLKRDTYNKDEKINVSSLSKGLYTLQFDTPNETKIFKLIVL